MLVLFGILNIPAVAKGNSTDNLSIIHQFKSGDVISSSKMNENFENLLKRTSLNKTYVDCDAGETVNSMLDKYNHIIISGTCNENINIEYINDPQAVLILEGASEDATIDKIISNDSDNTTINIGSGPVSVKISNITISGGNNGLGIYHSPYTLIDNCIIENNSGNGVRVADSYIKILNSTIRDNSENGINAFGQTFGNFQDNQIENHSGNNGISMSGGSYGYIIGNSVVNARIGIYIGSGTTAYIGDKPKDDGTKRGNTLTGPFERGIEIERNSYAKLTANTISGYSQTGIEITRNSYSQIGSDSDQDTYDSNQRNDYGNSLDGTEISGQSVDDWQWGIRVESSSVTLNRNLIENHQRGGIRASEQSMIEFGGGNIIQNNKHTKSNGDINGTGIEIIESSFENWMSAQEREPNTISNNGEKAFYINSGNLNLYGGRLSKDENNSISQSNRFIVSGHETGIRADKGSVVNLQRVDIKENSEYGIKISENSILYTHFDSDNEDESGGVIISNNGPNNGDCSANDDGYGLSIKDSSVASLKFIKIIDNCEGVRVERNSTMDGGWAGGNSNISYGIIIQGNKRNGMEVKKNSSIDLEYLKLGGSNSGEGNSQINDSGWYEQAIDLEDGSYAKIEQSLIEGNFGSAIEVESNSILELEDSTIQNNGHGSQNNDAIILSENSKIDIEDSIITHDYGNTISAWGGDNHLEIENSDVTNNYNSESHKGNAININGGTLDFHGNSSDEINLNAVGHPIYSDSGAEIKINSNIDFYSETDYEDIKLNESKLILNSDELLINNLYLGDDSKLFFYKNHSNEVVTNLNCSSGIYQNGIQLYRPGIVHLNNNNETIISNASSSCVMRSYNTTYEAPPNNPTSVFGNLTYGLFWAGQIVSTCKDANGEGYNLTAYSDPTDEDWNICKQSCYNYFDCKGVTYQKTSGLFYLFREESMLANDHGGYDKYFGYLRNF